MDLDLQILVCLSIVIITPTGHLSDHQGYEVSSKDLDHTQNDQYPHGPTRANIVRSFSLLSATTFSNSGGGIQGLGLRWGMVQVE